MIYSLTVYSFLYQAIHSHTIFLQVLHDSIMLLPENRVPRVIMIPGPTSPYHVLIPLYLFPTRDARHPLQWGPTFIAPPPLYLLLAHVPGDCLPIQCLIEGLSECLHDVFQLIVIVSLFFLILCLFTYTVMRVLILGVHLYLLYLHISFTKRYSSGLLGLVAMS
jgi:hypothetical protein